MAPSARELALFERMGRWGALPEIGTVRRRDLTVRGPGGNRRRARLYEPDGLPAGAGLAVFVHGGGWQLGSVDAYDGLCAFLARSAQLKVLSLDYRLSWQARFPAAFDDVAAGFADAVDRASELGVAGDRIGIVGDSAGGNLAAAVALHLGSVARYRPKLAALVYPVVDSELDRYESAHLFSSPLSREIVHRDMRRYVSAEGELRDPRFSVMGAADASTMPPTYIATAGMDVLRDQSEAFGERLRGSDVDVTVERFTNLPHGFLGMLVDPDARRATVEIADAIGKRIRATLP
jgi:acetyl esterase